MGRFRNVATDVVVAVDDSKDDRFAGADWVPADGSKPAPKAAANKAAPAKPDRK